MPAKERIEGEETGIRSDLSEMEKALGKMSLIHMTTVDESYYKMGEPLSKLACWGGGIEKISDFDPNIKVTGTGVLFAAHWDRSWLDKLTAWEGPTQEHLGNYGVYLFMTDSGSCEQEIAYLKKIVGDGEYRQVNVKLSPETDHEIQEINSSTLPEGCKNRVNRILGQEIRLREMQNKFENLHKSQRQDLYVRLEIQQVSNWLANEGEKSKNEKEELAQEMFLQAADRMRKWAVGLVRELPEQLKDPFENEKTSKGYILESSWMDIQNLEKTKDPVWWQKRDLFNKKIGLAALICLLEGTHGLEMELFEYYSRESLRFFEDNPEAELSDYQWGLDLTKPDYKEEYAQD